MMVTYSKGGYIKTRFSVGKRIKFGGVVMR